MEAKAFDWGPSKIVRIQAGSFFLVALTEDGATLAYSLLCPCQPPEAISDPQTHLDEAFAMLGVHLPPAGKVFQIVSDYSLVAGLPDGRSKPRAVANIPPGSVIKDLIAGEAFAMAVLANGQVYVPTSTT